MEDLQIFQMLQAADGRDVLGVARRDDQHPQLGHVVQEGQVLKLVVPEIQRVQVFAEPDDFHDAAGVPLRVIGMQRGKSGLVRPERMLPKGHRHPELDVGEFLVELLHLLVVDGHAVHVHLLQVRKL